MKFGKMPDDPFFEDMDPFVKLWLYESWVHEIELEYDKMKQLGILIGSFYNPQAARKMIKKDQPDYSTSDKEFEESVRMVQEHVQKQDELEQEHLGKRRKKRRRVIK